MGVPSDLRVAGAWPACWACASSAPGLEELCWSPCAALWARLLGTGSGAQWLGRPSDIWLGMPPRPTSLCLEQGRSGPACIFEPSMGPFECEHKTSVSQGLGEGGGRKPTCGHTAWMPGPPRGGTCGHCTEVQTHDRRRYSLVLGAGATAPSGGCLAISGCSECILHSANKAALPTSGHWVTISSCSWSLLLRASVA